MWLVVTHVASRDAREALLASDTRATRILGW
jgi:hypothetical protein